MNEPELEMIMSLVVEREELAYKRLKNNSKYIKLCKQQVELNKIVEELYHSRFTDEERITVRRYYEGETEKSIYETNEVYLQGMRDCFKMVTYLGLLLD